MNDRTDLKEELNALVEKVRMLDCKIDICKLVTTCNLDIKDLQEIYTLILEKKTKEM